MEGEVQLGVITLIVLLVAAWIFFTYHQLPKTEAYNARKAEVADNLSKMKRLWVEKSYLTRMANIEDITGYTGSSITNEKIISNGNQIGRNFSNLYGPEAGDTLTSLLLEYHRRMFDFLHNVRHRKDVTHDYEKLKEKNLEIAYFVTKICPNLDKTRVLALFDGQLDNLVKTVVHTMRDENVASMAAFDAYNKATQDLAEYLGKCIWENLIGPYPQHR